MMDRTVRLAALVAVAASTFVLLPSVAHASTLQCGDVITKDTTLDRDLIGCPGDGLVIGADGITLDLNGHSIVGTGSGSGGIVYEDTRNGVDNTAAHTRVTIENGEIGNFDVGVKLRDASANRLTDLDVHGNQAGVLPLESSGNRIEANHIHDNAYGIYPYEADGNRITDNRVNGNSFGMYPVNSSDNLIEGNSIVNNIILGMQVTDGSSRNRVRDNSIIHSKSVGLLVSGGSVDNRVENNVLVDHPFAGILLDDAARSLVRRNRIVNASLPDSAFGLYGFGLYVVVHSDYAVLQRNLVLDYRQGVKVDGSKGVTVSRNEFRGNVHDGILVVANAASTLIDRNVASQNGDDGIDVGDASATISGNVADSNGDLGIEAVPGVTGYRNLARNNGNAAQCVPASLCSTSRKTK